MAAGPGPGFPQQRRARWADESVFEPIGWDGTQSLLSNGSLGRPLTYSWQCEELFQGLDSHLLAEAAHPHGQQPIHFGAEECPGYAAAHISPQRVFVIALALLGPGAIPTRGYSSLWAEPPTCPPPALPGSPRLLT